MEEQSKVNEFISLLTVNQQAIFCFILARVISVSDAEDVMQDVAAEMWSKFSQYESGTNFLAWGMQIARYKILDYRAKTESYRKHLSDATIELLDSDQRRSGKVNDQQIEQLRLCINQLPHPLRNLIRTRYTDGLPPKLIAHQYGRQLYMVYRMLAKARELLLVCMKRAAASLL